MLTFIAYIHIHTCCCFVSSFPALFVDGGSVHIPRRHVCSMPAVSRAELLWPRLVNVFQGLAAGAKCRAVARGLVVCGYGGQAREAGGAGTRFRRVFSDAFWKRPPLWK